MTLNWTGDEALRRLKQAAGEGLFDGAEYLLETANRTVPFEEGDLAGSGAVDVDREGLTATVSYDEVYAARQHEELTWRHVAGRRAKWLELTLNEESQAIAQMIARRMQGAL